MEVKEEELQSVDQSVSGAGSAGLRSDGTVLSASSSRTSDTSTARQPSNPTRNNKSKRVTIKIRDPDKRSELSECGGTLLLELLKLDLLANGIDVPVRIVFTLERSGDVRIITESLEGAKILRNPRKWRPRYFGQGAYVKHPNT